MKNLSAHLRRSLAAFSGVVLTAWLALFGATPAHAAPVWYDGAIAYSSVVNCGSIIWGSPYQGYGLGAFIGQAADPEAGTPAVNQTFYIHVYVAGLGNNCQGFYFVPAFVLPAGVTFGTTQPIYCNYDDQAQSGAGCPQWGNVGASGWGGDYAYYMTNPQAANMWPLAQGHTWEFRLPVRSDRPLTSANWQAYIKTIDGNSSPTLTPSASRYVFGAGQPPSILYDTPSTTAYVTTPPGGANPPPFGVLSTAQLVTQGASGTGGFQIGTSPGSYTQQVSFGLPAGHTSWTMWNDWDDPAITPLVAGGTYYWRAFFTPTGGSTVFGAQQTLVMPLSKTCQGLPVTIALSLGQQPTGGDDVILGTNGIDVINANAGNDTVCALAASDIISGGLGNDVIDAGSGFDTVTFAGAASGATASLAVTTAQTTGEGSDTITGVENLTGSQFSDRLTGNAADNVLEGGPGNDILDPGAGNDRVDGGSGTDTVTYATASGPITVNLGVTGYQNTGGSATDSITTIENVTGSIYGDVLTGNNLANKLLGGSGPDTINGGTGNDRLDGGPGVDTVSYAGAGSGIVVSLATTAAQVTSGAGTDTLSLFENLTGSSFSDTLTGSTASNIILGGAGNDIINGGAGNDRLDGSTGVDTVSYAGAGAAIKVSLAVTSAQLTGGSGLDTLTSFERLTGSSFNDNLTGNSGNNILTGGAGIDRCDGGLGTDQAVTCETLVGIP